MQIGADAQTVQEHGGIRFRIPAVHLGEFRFQFAGTDTVLIGKIFLSIDGVLLLHDLIESFIAHDDSVHDRINIIFKVILFQHGEALAGSDRYIAVCGLQSTGEDL